MIVGIREHPLHGWATKVVTLGAETGSRVKVGALLVVWAALLLTKE